MDMQITLTGYLVGKIWMPARECWKHLSYDLTREDARFTEPGTLRDHVLAATRDGDFQSCSIAEGYLHVQITKIQQTGTALKTYRRTRSFPLTMFPSVKDCINTEWDGPTYDEE
jgi:hypothetical protein